MPLFRVETLVPYQVGIWRHAITESLARLNATPLPAGMMLELAGGCGPIAAVATTPVVIIDRAIGKMAPGKLNVCADACKLPLPGDCVALAVTVSSLQYMDHVEFFAECRRVVAPGGVVAVHENGCCNPFILAARVAQRLVGLRHRQHWEYRNTIRRYHRPTEVPDGFEMIYRNSDGLLEPIVFILESMGVTSAARLLPMLRGLDTWLLRVPGVNRLAFLHVVHLRKAHDASAREATILGQATRRAG
jgi:SAM-dependent methyltransferase